MYNIERGNDTMNDTELFINLPFMFFIEEFINSLYGRVYNIDIFLINNLLILIYFAFHYKSFISSINKFNKADIVYKKYKGAMIIQIAFNYFLAISLCYWFTSFIYYDNDILWNILFSPFIAATVSTAVDSRILRRIEKRIYNDIRRIEFENYKKSLKKIIEAQEIQQNILNLHNRELNELRKNIGIVEEMMHFDEEEKVNNQNEKAQGRKLP